MFGIHMKIFSKRGLQMTRCMSQSLVVVSHVPGCSKYVYLQALITPSESTNQNVILLWVKTQVVPKQSSTQKNHLASS